ERLMAGLGQILVSGQRMSALIEQVLDLSRLQLGRPLELHRAPTDLVALVRGVISASDQLTEQHSVTLTCDLQAVVGSWDGARLERAVQNLISNAIKFSPDGGEVTVGLTRDVR